MGANAETVLDLADLTISWKEGLILSLYRSPGSRRWASWLVSHRTGAQTSPLAPSRPFSPCHPASGTTCSLALLELTCPKCGTHTAMKDGWMDGWTAGTAGLYCPSPASGEAAHCPAGDPIHVSSQDWAADPSHSLAENPRSPLGDQAHVDQFSNNREHL